MKLLVDTHLLLWAAKRHPRLSPAAADLMASRENDLWFSAASIWEVAIKSARRRLDFEVDAARLWRELLREGYGELAITSEHALEVARLPLLHHDPFDRLLLAQATVEGMLLLTADARLASYPGPIRRV